MLLPLCRCVELCLQSKRPCGFNVPQMEVQMLRELPPTHVGGLGLLIQQVIILIIIILSSVQRLQLLSIMWGQGTLGRMSWFSPPSSGHWYFCDHPSSSPYKRPYTCHALPKPACPAPLTRYLAILSLNFSASCFATHKISGISLFFLILERVGSLLSCRTAACTFAFHPVSF